MMDSHLLGLRHHEGLLEALAVALKVLALTSSEEEQIKKVPATKINLNSILTQ